MFPKPNHPAFQPGFQPDFQGIDEASLEGLYQAFPQLRQAQGFTDASTGATGTQMTGINDAAMNAQNQFSEGMKHGNEAIGQTWNPWFDAVNEAAGGDNVKIKNPSGFGNLNDPELEGATPLSGTPLSGTPFGLTPKSKTPELDGLKGYR